MDRLYERGVVVGECCLVGGQAGGGRAHDIGLPLGRGLLQPLPPQRRGQAAARGQRRERFIAFAGQGLGAAAPQRLGIARPLRIRRAGGQARVELRAAQRGALYLRRPGRAEASPVLDARPRGQPVAAECLGHGLAAITVQEGLRLCGQQQVHVPAQRCVFHPAVGRMRSDAGILRGVEAARFGRGDRGAQDRVGRGALREGG